ncbi:MAG: SulP family inorganic anion transporter [Owenweeksia sp.]|nr:SulP family inorganic anion transporter [Owenweeksia sp.]
MGNIISGLIGGLPITQVIVRSSANSQSGGRTKASAVIHGFLILISLAFIPGLINLYPLCHPCRCLNGCPGYITQPNRPSSKRCGVRGMASSCLLSLPLPRYTSLICSPDYSLG